MAITIAEVADAQDVFGKTPCTVVTLTPDTSFPAGGYALVPANFGMGGAILGIDFIGGNTATVGYIPLWNYQTGKFTIFVSSTGAEVTGDKSALTFKARVYCSAQ